MNYCRINEAEKLKKKIHRTNIQKAGTKKERKKYEKRERKKYYKKEEMMGRKKARRKE